MNTESRTESRDEVEGPGGARPRRLLLPGIAFVAFEALFILGLGEKVYDFSYFSPGMWAWCALAASGYFALGFFSRSWWSATWLVTPLLVAVYFVTVVWTTELAGGGTIGVNANFAEIWLELSLLFVPAWALGILFSRRVNLARVETTARL